MQALVVAAGPEVPPTSSPGVLKEAWQYLSATAIVLSSDDGLPPGDPDPCVFLVEIALVSVFFFEAPAFRAPHHLSTYVPPCPCSRAPVWQWLCAPVCHLRLSRTLAFGLIPRFDKLES
jgi:hypothetical protein